MIFAHATTRKKEAKGLTTTTKGNVNVILIRDYGSHYRRRRVIKRKCATTIDGAPRDAQGIMTVIYRVRN